MKKTAIVTGSSRGIGFAIARQLGLDGYNIVMVATGVQEKNQDALDALKELGIDCVYVQANIGDHDDRLKIVEGAVAAFGRIDALVNNAGVAPKVRADLLEMSEESFDRVVGINTKGNMFLTQAVAGVSMLTTLYADRLACEGILVHEVRPGVIATDMTGTVKAKYDDLIAKGTFPIARWGQPEDVANAVSALCSDKFLYSTGNYIDIDGGFHIPRL